MIVGVLSLDVSLFESQTLKDKRRVIKGLKDRIRNRFNVSVAEVAYNDLPKRSRIAVAAVGNEGRFIQAVMDKVVDLTRATARLSLIEYHCELI